MSLSFQPAESHHQDRLWSSLEMGVTTSGFGGIPIIDQIRAVVNVSLDGRSMFILSGRTMQKAPDDGEYLPEKPPENQKL